MSDNKDIKFAGLQMLTGGAYFGTETAVGHPAEFMISYPGFDAPKFNKEGKLVDAGNEYFLLEYLKKHDRSVPYYQFDRAPFQDDYNMEPTILQNGKPVEHHNYENIDLVVAVPVCAGLSGASTASTERKNACNNNMLYLASYALNVIKPKVYVFENAPRLMGDTGIVVREKLERIAKDANYSVAYYKTNTYWHDNCQDRQRTFVYFFRADGDRKGAPNLGFEHKHVTVSEFLSRIPSNSTENHTMPKSELCTSMYDYFKHLHGEEWRSKVKTRSLISELVKTKQLDAWNNFVQNSDSVSDKTKKQVDRLVKHIYDKAKDGKGFYETTFTLTSDDKVPAAMFKTIPFALHHSEDRLYTMREWMSFMGMPYDFEMPGDVCLTFRKIGQNVPARTMQFIASEAVNVIKNWDTVERGPNLNVMFFDNIKEKSSLMKDL